MIILYIILAICLASLFCVAWCDLHFWDGRLPETILCVGMAILITTIVLTAIFEGGLV